MSYLVPSERVSGVVATKSELGAVGADPRGAARRRVVARVGVLGDRGRGVAAVGAAVAASAQRKRPVASQVVEVGAGGRGAEHSLDVAGRGESGAGAVAGACSARGHRRPWCRRRPSRRRRRSRRSPLPRLQRRPVWSCRRRAGRGRRWSCLSSRCGRRRSRRRPPARRGRRRESALIGLRLAARPSVEVLSRGRAAVARRPRRAPRRWRARPCSGPARRRRRRARSRPGRCSARRRRPRRAGPRSCPPSRR